MRCLPLALIVALTGIARAQAPVITPAGDPSVNSDTICRLAVNPADYPDEPYVYLLDDGVLRFEADGRGTETYRQVVQILKQEAAADFAEFQFSFSASRQKLTINWMRVLRPDGAVISAAPAQEQESDAPVTLRSPMYSDLRRHRVTLAGVAPGTLVDWSYTLETLRPVMPGDFFTSWSVNTGRLTRRSRLIVDVPAFVAARIKETNLRFPRQTSVAHGRRVTTWATSEVPKTPEAEPFARDTDDVYTGIAVGSPESWDDVARWSASRLSDRFALTPELEAKLAATVRGQATGEDSLRALYRWITQEVRSVSVSLGLGAYQPRLPEKVLRTGFGDCKDKTTLFVALARRMGLEAYPVLTGLSVSIDSALPSLTRFDHMIASVVRPGGPLYLDLTSTAVPVGLLPAALHGEFGLVMHPDGHADQVRLPRDSVSDNLDDALLTGVLTPDGIFAGRLTVIFTGTWQLGIREDLSNDVTAQQRADMTRSLANDVFDGATGDSLELFDGRDLTAPARLSVAIRDARATTRSGSSDVLTLPMKPTIASATVAAAEARRPRRYHIDASQIFGIGTDVSEIRVQLPEGWRARLPAGVRVSGEFGSYSATYEQQGRELRVVRRAAGARGVFPPDRVDDLLAFLRAVAADDVRYIVLEHP
jgi:transglutaminase-like putative cysteine protease